MEPYRASEGALSDQWPVVYSAAPKPAGSTRPLMASAIIGSVPVVIVYALSLDWFISGMTTGGVK